MKGTKIPLGNGCAVSFFFSFLFLFLLCLGNISRTICWGGQGFKLIKKFPKEKLLVWKREVTVVVVVVVVVFW